MSNALDAAKRVVEAFEEDKQRVFCRYEWFWKCEELGLDDGDTMHRSLFEALKAGIIEPTMGAWQYRCVGILA